ncbi:hypothetical protein [Thermocrinis sp.]
MKFEDFKSRIEGLRYLSKGWRGIIYKGFFEGKEVAIKVAKSAEKEYAIRKESDILEKLRDYEYFPKLLVKGEDFFIYEFIDGLPFDKLELSPEDRLRIYLRVLDIAFLLDKLRINRDELARLDKNLLVSKDGKVYLLDFDRGALNVKKPHNFTQFLQFLRKEGVIPYEQVVSLGKAYRSDPEDTYRHVKTLLESALSSVA